MSRALRIRTTAIGTTMLAMAVLACGGGLKPAQLSSGDSCSYCRMTVSDPRTVGQIVASAEDPRFFDDLGCLRDYLREHRLAANARVYVTDHRTGEWVPGDVAVFARVSSVDTPMGSNVLAWSDDSSRSSDSASAGADPLARTVVLPKSEGGTQ